MVSPNKKVVIVHDWLVGGGAEKVVEELHKLYPDAPVYTSYCTDEWRKRLDNKVITGYLQKWPFSKLRKFLPLIRGWWFKSLDLSNYDVVISSSGNGEAKNLKLPKNTLHVNYCHSPVHFYWDKYDEYLKHPSFRPHWLASLGLRILIKPLRNRDFKAAQKVDYFIANSTHIQKQIKKYYGRDSVVIHPPVETDRFAKASVSKSERNGFVVWGRHVPYKRFDIAINACNELSLPLKIVGIGPETENLKRMSGPTITFAGRVSDDELLNIAGSAEAFLFPGEEDFGIAPVEAMAAGLPIVAYKSGGALDYVHENSTGKFFGKQTVGSLVSTLKDFSAKNYSSKNLKEEANKYLPANFAKKISSLVDNL